MGLLSGIFGMLPVKAYTYVGFQQVTPPDTTAGDTTRVPYKPGKRPTFQPVDRHGDPFSSRTSQSPLYPSPNTSMEVEIDTGLNYTIYENLGDVRYRPVTTMSLEEYNNYMRQRTIRDYWKNQSAGLDGESPVSGRSLIPPIYTSPLFDRIFGGSFVNIRPNGFVNLDFGARFDRVENPALPIRAQRRNQFQFDQQINMNVVGEIGEKLRVTANYDSNNSFDFENNFRVEYTGFEEEIIKKIELGNVSLPVRNSLMSGAQSLFGVKTQLQFGRLFITGVATTQRGETDAVVIENGSQSSTFSVRASEYDNNRHFFMGHFFRDNYGIRPGQWLSRLPQVTSGVNITRLEVYVVNRNNDTQTLRNVAAFADLGEGEPENARLPANDFVRGAGFQPGPNRNEANGLFNNLKNNPDLRSIDQINGALDAAGLINNTDYVVIKSARKLDAREYTFNSVLGYLSLNRQLQNDEALAVAYEYTFNGQRYQVGELTENYQEREASDIIFMKMLRPNTINTAIPTWDLMMKNIYNLNASQVSREGFELRILYRDDRSTVDNPNLQEGANTNNIPLVRVLGLDQLNQANDPQPDGNFDFIEGITINLERGNIIFPVTEPFGSHLASQFEENEQALINRYVYDTLYNTTQNQAEQVVSKNKYFLTGSYSAGSTNEIALPGINIAEGSVRVMAGNIPLTEGVDYQVDYNFGRVRLLNEGITNSGKKITISFEKASLLNFQTRRFLGTQFDYIFNEDFSIGGTLLYLNELPLVTRVNIGDEPTKNTKWGLDLNYRKDSRFLTRMVDRIPLIQTKELSTFALNAEFAQMVPGTSNVVTGEGTSYIDDFEAAITTYSLSNSISTWNMAATPETADNLFFGQAGANQLDFGYRRAKLAWYVVDNIFYNERDRSRYAPNLNKERMQNHYFRPVSQQEIFKRDVRTYNPNELIFDMAYFPAERGSYNYNPNLRSDGTLPNPELNWGGITRAITSNVDFDQTNIEYLEFWMMDPFISGENGRNEAFQEYNITNEGSGGKLVFNLGSISEDYIKDKRHGFENGLPPTPENTPEVETNAWGRVTTKQYLNNAFAVDPEARLNQDVGMDGLRNDAERTYFRDFINSLTGTARTLAEEDPSADNFSPFVSEELTARDANVITRYKNFNNQEGNTPINSGNSGFTVPSKSTPDNEDLNEDNTINDLEAYYEYVLNLQPGNMEVGRNHIVDKVTATPTNSTTPATWYLFRIPIRNPNTTYGGITDFKSIRFMRTYLTGFRDPVLLRFAKMQLVGSQWRKFQQDLLPDGIGEKKDYDPSNFVVTAVSYEDNGIANGGSIPYVIPPGFIRDRDNTAYNQNVRVNEQSIQLCVDDLPNKDARAVYKNVSLDLINYGTIKMLLHAHADNGSFVNDNEVTAFLRLGYDYTENYYEVEIPLKITPAGSTNPAEIWPAENEIDIALDELYQLKALRNRQNRPLDARFGGQSGKHNIYVKGNPEMSNIVSMMIGVRNPNTVNDDKSSKSVCIWANELRVTDFDRRAGWAGNARMNTRLADLADISASTRYTSVGFGNISDKVSQRTREELLSYDVAANIALEKFLPENSRLQLPMFVSFEKSISTPYFDPASPDLPLSSTLESFETDEERDNYRFITQNRGTRRSINFTNLRLTPKEGKTPTLISPENFSLTYAYSDVVNTSWEIANYELKTYKGAIGYNYTPEVNPIQPFANAESLNSPYLQWLKDFNFTLKPSNISVRWDLDRRYQMRQLRNADLTPQEDLQFEKLFTMNRQYSMRWSLTNSLMLDYNARANAIIDEPAGAIDSDIKRDSVAYNLTNLGRMKHFDQTIGLTYRLPFDKFPLTNWISAETRYETGYNWTAGSVDIRQQEEFGNTIQNNRTYNASGKLDLVKLYNRVGYLKKVNDESQRQGRPQAPQRPGQRPGQNGQTKEEPANQGLGAAKGIVRFLMAVRSVNVNYQRTQGTMLPGFKKRAFLFGLDSSFVAPGIPFLLGSQDPGIRFAAAENQWLVESSQLTTPFTQADGESFDIRGDVQPLNDFRIQLDLKKNKTANYQEIFRYDSIGQGEYVSLTPSRSGNYSISFNTLATAFDKRLDNNGSEAFEKFAQYRFDILRRLRELPNAGQGEFTERSQDALIPAFIAAYSGKDPDKVKLSPFPSIPLPNWRVDYAGLAKLPAIKERFSAFTITHGYVSRYSVNNYNNSLIYQGEAEKISLDRNVERYTSADNTRTNAEQGTNNLVPLYVANQVVITEQFAPLIGVSLRTKKRLSTNISYNKERNLALNLSNTQLTEQSKRDVRIDFSYTTANFKLPFRSRGREIILKNDIAFKMGLTIMRNQIIQRKFDEPDDITNGNVSFQLNPTVNYTINQQLSLMMYYNSSVNDPLVQTSFRNTQTSFGVQVRYNITQ